MCFFTSHLSWSLCCTGFCWSPLLCWNFCYSLVFWVLLVVPCESFFELVSSGSPLERFAESKIYYWLLQFFIVTNLLVVMMGTTIIIQENNKSFKILYSSLYFFVSTKPVNLFHALKTIFIFFKCFKQEFIHQSALGWWINVIFTFLALNCPATIQLTVLKDLLLNSYFQVCFHI